MSVPNCSLATEITARLSSPKSEGTENAESAKITGQDSNSRSAGAKILRHLCIFVTSPVFSQFRREGSYWLFLSLLGRLVKDRTWISGAGYSGIVGDFPTIVEIQKGHIHVLHAEFFAHLNFVVHQVRFSISDQLANRRSRHADFAGQDLALAISAGQKILRDDCLQ